MNKHIATFIILSLVLLSVQFTPVLAWWPLLPTAVPTPKLLIKPGLNLDLFKIIPTLPPAAVITPSATPVPPTSTPIPPTLTPIPPTATAAPTKEVEQISAPPSAPTASPTASSVTITPTPIPEKGGLTQTEMILGGVGGLFGVTILVLLWPKVRLFFQKK